MTGSAATAERSPHGADATRTLAGEMKLTLGLASLSAALIHVMAGVHHFAEWWLFGVGFMVMAVAQAVSAATLALSDARPALVAAVALNAPIVLLWAWSRTLGLPIGPEAGTAEGIGVADVMASVTEAVIVAGAVASLRGARATTLSALSTTAMLAFAVGAFTGFGHFHGH
jgi:hypothetical protein